MGRKALSPEQKAANDAYRASPTGMQEKVLKSKLKTVVNSAEALKATQPELSDKITEVVNQYRNFQTLSFQLQNRPDSYVGNVRTALERRVQSLRTELAETESKLNSVDVNASVEALNTRVSNTRNRLNEAISSVGNIQGKSITELLELNV